MEIRKVRRLGLEKILAVPRVFAERLTSDHLAVDMDESGTLTFKQIVEAEKKKRIAMVVCHINKKHEMT